MQQFRGDSAEDKRTVLNFIVNIYCTLDVIYCDWSVGYPEPACLSPGVNEIAAPDVAVRI